jgi:hypothetical protein
VVRSVDRIDVLPQCFRAVDDQSLPSAQWNAASNRFRDEGLGVSGLAFSLALHVCVASRLDGNRRNSRAELFALSGGARLSE